MAQTKGRAEVAKKANALQTLKVEYVSVDAVKPNSYNPNRQSPRDFDLLLRSMREDGFTQPVIVQRATNEIVDGEHRWRAAKELEMTEIPVVYVDMTEQQMRVSTLRHNRARGSEDFELTKSLLHDLRELGALDWAQDSLMLDSNEISRLLDDESVPEALAGPSFTEAWEPAQERPDQPAVTGRMITNDPNQVGPDGTTTSFIPAARTPVYSGATPDAVDRIAAAQAAIDMASSGKERYDLMQQRNLFRLTLSFAGSEADVVKQALGAEPAVKLIELCNRWEAEHPAAEAVAAG